MSVFQNWGESCRWGYRNMSINRPAAGGHKARFFVLTEYITGGNGYEKT